MYPEDLDATPPDNLGRAADRRWPRGGLVVAAAASVAAVVVALAAGKHLVSNQKQPGPAAAASAATSPTTSPTQRVSQRREPAWAAACFPADPKLDYGNAPAYVGLTPSRPKRKPVKTG